MEDLNTVAWMLRYGARSLAHNLSLIPAEKLTWKPDPAAKCALEIATEVIRALMMYRPIFDGPEYPATAPPLPDPASMEEAVALLLDTVEEYSNALEAAGAELHRPQEMPFGGVFLASRAVCFPLMDLFNHHGQILYIQSLLGDPEMHWDLAAVEAEFVWKQPTAPEG